MPTELEAGSPAPDFTLPDQNGTPIRLEDYRGKVVVLYMYPKDDTPGCTQEACDFRDNLSPIQAAGAIVLGLSPDSPASHKVFQQKYELPFTLLADEEGTVAQLYGAWKEKNTYGHKYMGVERSTFIIDPEGILRAIYRQVNVPGHVDQVLKDVQHPASAAR